MAEARVSAATLLSRYLRLVPTMAQALRTERVSHLGLQLRIPGTRRVRLSVLAGNVRICALLNRVARPGATVVDVGANIGVISAFAAQCVGSTGQVIAIEPAADNLAVLRENLRANDLRQVDVRGSAAGSRRGSRALYLRGEVSAVNSLFPDSCYASVTGVAQVDVERLDDVVDGEADVVKIDVEGAELDVLAGMPRLLASPWIHLIVEWHPLLQRAAGHRPDQLPRALIEAGFRVDGIGDLSSRSITSRDVASVATRLERTRRPIELFARY
jgi:FkbM family methyltransferase